MMKLKILWGIALIAIAFAAVPLQAEVVFQDDFETYPVSNPADFSATGNWTADPDASNASRIFDTGNFGGSRLWISNTDGSTITTTGTEAASETRYEMTFMTACETNVGTRMIDMEYDILIGQDAATATSVIGGPVTVIARGDEYQVDDSKEDHIFTEVFTTSMVNAGDKIFFTITRVGVNPDSTSSAWICVDDVLLESLGSTRAPTLVQPEDGADLVSPDVTLEWNAPDLGTADSYNLIYNTDPNFDSNPTVVSGLTTTSHSPGLDYDSTYYWAVEAVQSGTPYRSAIQSFTTTPASPVIVADPQNVTVAAGEPAELTVEHLNGTEFKWFRNGTEVPSATSATLQIPAAGESDEGVYYCEVSNAVGSVQSGNAVVMTQRLVAHWDFENDLIDEVGGREGVFTDPNAPTARYVAGFDGTSTGFEFIGDNKFIEVPGTEELFNFYTNGFSVGYWVKTTGGTHLFSAMVAKHTYSDPRAGFICTQYNGNGQTRIQVDGFGGLYGPSADIAGLQDGGWHYVIMTYEPDADPENPGQVRARVYVDGGGVTIDPDGNAIWMRTADTREPEAATLPVRWDTPLRIGADDEAGAGSLVGTLDEVKVWSYALDPTEAAQQYTGYVTGTEICTDILANDINGDCKVNIADLADLAGNWLSCNRVPDCK
ncbi:Immunoglobulin I-set domain protein [Anaerohalosphaera lusitana]|uniref:Immunoglobulin I-set domain protein n=1 Tax=Anaerohalosphaera lusitana TaxID=1936003 RepID=A0A1U9NK43_9BACT|nr:LamG-like jellyroll fold domain-containing protein [Anaerohalosphaera lusitana]AQT68185.1 Immunoglobulin I-set domain protein [Anaerohalosphaera lusitana]